MADQQTSDAVRGGVADLGCPGRDCSIVEEAEAHHIVALSMVSRRPYYGHARSCLSPAAHAQGVISTRSELHFRLSHDRLQWHLGPSL